MAPFIVYVCADLYNSKVNLELSFPSFPTMTELTNHIQSVFTAECVALRPAGATAQNFGISKIQHHNDANGTWTDLNSSSMLRPFAQLYVFQSDPNYREGQNQIGPARKPASYGSLSPTRHRDASSSQGGNGLNSTVTAPNGSRQYSPARDMYFGSPAERERPKAPYNTPVAAGRASGGSAGSAARTPLPGTSSVYQMRHDQPPAFSSQPTTPLRNGGARSTSNTLAALTPTSGAIQVASNLFASSAAHGDKARIIFECADKRQTRQLQEGDWRALLRDVNIDFAPFIISALFRQADTDRDGVISYTDFQLMLKEYPTLTDALFFRLKDQQETELLQMRLAEECVSLEDARRRQEQTRAAAEEVEQQMEVLDREMAGLDAEWQQRVTAENELTEALNNTNRLYHEAEDTVAAMQKELTHVLGQDDHARRSLADAERETVYVRQQHTKAKSQLASAEDRVRELQEALEAAKGEVCNQSRNVEEAELEVRRAEDRERRAAQVLHEAHDSLNRRKQDVDARERAARDVQAKARELTNALSDCQVENERLAQKIANASNDRKRMQQVAETAHQEDNLSKAAIEDCERRVATADSAIVLFAQRRSATEAKERPLIEQEMRLREQRLQLDSSESQLRREAFTVFDPAVRGGSFSGSR